MNVLIACEESGVVRHKFEKRGHKVLARRLPAHVRKALRDYRRKVIPMADEPRGCDDITPALWCVLAGAVAFVVVLAIAGALP